MKVFLTILAGLMFAANAFFLLFWFWVGHPHGVGPGAQPLSSYDAISLQITILSVTLAIVAVGLGVAALFGYQGLRDHMLMKLEQELNTRLNNQTLPKGPLPGLTQKGPEVPLDTEVRPSTEG